jgi:hypothetical protein
MKNEDVVRLFADGHGGATANLRSDGQSLWSYNTLIARRVGGTVHAVKGWRYSNTTSRHLNLMHAALVGERVVTYTNPKDMERGAHDARVALS